MSSSPESVPVLVSDSDSGPPPLVLSPLSSDGEDYGGDRSHPQDPNVSRNVQLGFERKN